MKTEDGHIHLTTTLPPLTALTNQMATTLRKTTRAMLPSEMTMNDIHLDVVKTKPIVIIHHRKIISKPVATLNTLNIVEEEVNNSLRLPVETFQSIHRFPGWILDWVKGDQPLLYISLLHRTPNLLLCIKLIQAEHLMLGEDPEKIGDRNVTSTVNHPIRTTTIGLLKQFIIHPADHLLMLTCNNQ